MYHWGRRSPTTGDAADAPTTAPLASGGVNSAVQQTDGGFPHGCAGCDSGGNWCADDRRRGHCDYTFRKKELIQNTAGRELPFRLFRRSEKDIWNEIVRIQSKILVQPDRIRRCNPDDNTTIIQKKRCRWLEKQTEIVYYKAIGIMKQNRFTIWLKGWPQWGKITAIVVLTLAVLARPWAGLCGWIRVRPLCSRMRAVPPRCFRRRQPPAKQGAPAVPLHRLPTLRAAGAPGTTADAVHTQGDYGAAYDSRGGTVHELVFGTRWDSRK